MLWNKISITTSSHNYKLKLGKSMLKQNITSQIAESYHQLIPSIEEGLLIISLYEKIKTGEIDPNFSNKDIQRTIEETVSLLPPYSNLPNKERLLKNLLTYFIERPIEQKNLYTLTEYSRKFVLLLEHKLNNPFRQFPLRESFKRYTNFSATEIKQINQFESWFNQGFQATTRENVFDHLEELRNQVKNAITRLNKLLYSVDIDPKSIVSDFSAVFSDLAEKADEIRDTLRLGNSLQYEIDLVVSFFYEKTQEYGTPITEVQKEEFNELHYAFSRASDIKEEVLSFFNIIDNKLGQLREQIQYASTKLNELQEFLRYQSQFRNNLRRLFEYIVEHSTVEKSILIFPEEFSKKFIVHEKFKLSAMPDLYKNPSQSNLVIQIPEDREYHQSELLLIEAELTRQQRTATLVNNLKETLKNNEITDLTKEFYNILEHENDEETAIQVVHEIIQYAHDNKMHELLIDCKVNTQYYNKPIITWTTTIKTER